MAKLLRKGSILLRETCVRRSIPAVGGVLWIVGWAALMTTAGLTIAPPRALATECANAGAQTTAPDDNTVAQNTACGNASVANGGGSTAVGGSANATGFTSTALGFTATASGTASTAVGSQSSATSASSTALGTNTSATGGQSTAVGNAASAGGQSTALGQGAQAANSDTALGTGAIATGTTSVAVGASSSATGDSSIAIGGGGGPLVTSAIGSHAIAVGFNTSAAGANGLAVGSSASAVGANSVALGGSATATGAGGTAVGASAQAGFVNSTAVGNSAVATRNNQQMFGTTTNTYTMAGIASAASAAVQTGVRQVVTSDASGNLATSSLAGLGSPRRRISACCSRRLTASSSGTVSSRPASPSPWRWRSRCCRPARPSACASAGAISVDRTRWASPQQVLWRAASLGRRHRSSSTPASDFLPARPGAASASRSDGDAVAWFDPVRSCAGLIVASSRALSARPRR